MKTTLLAAEKALYTPEAHNDFIWAVVGSPWGLLAIWLAIINIITFCVFGLDKWKAKRKEKNERVRRVPEKTLLLLAALGGSVGALLGMKAFRHKTLHKAFRFGVPVILILQVVLPFGLWLYFSVIR
jgi:uncharacterized membrane protein YsdA (DUF1294 family)